jgi:hypothetical protein
MDLNRESGYQEIRVQEIRESGHQEIENERILNLMP